MIVSEIDHMRPQFQRILLICLSYCLALSVAHASKLEDLVPHQATAVLLVDQPNQTLEPNGSSPNHTLCLEEILASVFGALGPSRDGHSRSAELWSSRGPTLETLIRLTHGGLLAFKLHNRSVDMGVESTRNDSDFGLVAEITTDGRSISPSVLRELTGQSPGHALPTTPTQQHRGVDLYLAQDGDGAGNPGNRGGWASVDGYFIGAGSISTLKKIVDRIAEGNQDRPSPTQDSFRSALDRVGGHQAFLYFDLTSPENRRFFRSALEDAIQANDVLSGIVAQIGTQTIDSLTSAFVNIRFTEQAISSDFSVTFGTLPPAFGLLGLGTESASAPSSLPRTVRRYGVAHVDFPSAWSHLARIVGSLNPMLLPMVNNQLTAMTTQAGIDLDLKRDLLDNLDGNVRFMEVFSPAIASNQGAGGIPTLVLPLRDSQRVGWVVDELRKLVAPDPRLVEVSDIHNLRIWTVHRTPLRSASPAGESADPVSVAIVGDTLIACLGDAETLNAVHDQISESRTRPATQQDGLSRCLRFLPSNYHALWFESSGVFDPVFAYGIGQLTPGHSPCEVSRESRFVSQPAPLATALYLDKNALMIRSRLVSPIR
ncbi:MAG: hypothetical protein GY906_06945 [bacterium]|nr:hypothetical protein [bacterium]